LRSGKCSCGSWPPFWATTGKSELLQWLFSQSTPSLFLPLLPPRSCLTPLLSAPSERSCEASHLFNQKLFLKSYSSSDSHFFNHFFDTQIFNAFIEQRSFAHGVDTRFVFFDECTEKVGERPPDVQTFLPLSGSCRPSPHVSSLVARRLRTINHLMLRVIRGGWHSDDEFW